MQQQALAKEDETFPNSSKLRRACVSSEDLTPSRDTFLRVSHLCYGCPCYLWLNKDLVTQIAWL